MTKQLSTAAQAAKLIRKSLKSTGLNVRVTSENYSMGDNVNVTMVDQTPEVMALVTKLCKRFQYGHFDGMTDSYNHDNDRKDIPQSKYVFVNNNMSDAMRHKIYAFVRAEYAGGFALPEKYEDARNVYFDNACAYVQEFVYRQFAQADSTFWQSQKEERRAA